MNLYSLGNKTIYQLYTLLYGSGYPIELCYYDGVSVLQLPNQFIKLRAIRCCAGVNIRVQNFSPGSFQIPFLCFQGITITGLSFG